MHKRHLPIAQPCHEDFGAMHDQGSGRRHCDSCEKSVHNFSDLTEGEARGLLKRHTTSRVCVRYRTNASGEILFKKATIPAPRVGMLAAMTNLMAGVALMALSGCTDGREPDRILEDKCEYDLGPWTYKVDRGEGNCPEPYDEVMGKIAPEEVPCTTDETIETMGDVGPTPDVIEPVVEPDPHVMGQKPVLEPDPVPEMGEAPPMEEELMGDIEAVEPDPVPEPDPEPEVHAKMGKIQVVPDDLDDL